MPRWESWVLTDVQNDVFVDAWEIDSGDMGVEVGAPFSIRSRTLRGGLRDGVHAVTIDNGALQLVVLPTRGMSIWRGQCGAVRLGWDAPLHGPVHPKFVPLSDFGGLGWLAGFDEWLVRCGLGSMGGPGVDRLPGGREVALGLHGQIANRPAHYVEVRANLEPPFDLEIIGRVEEGFLFHGRLELEAKLSLRPGEASFRLTDRVTNRGGSPAEMELLYHCNFGPPLLEAGAQMRLPYARVAPRDTASAAQMSDIAGYPAPRGGEPEAAFFYQPVADARGWSLALLHTRAADRGCAVRFDTRQMPWFVQWKNPGLVADGYVTGLEPGLQLPNFRGFERGQGRVPQLAPGESREFSLAFEVAESSAEVARLIREIETLQDGTKAVVESAPVKELSPG